MEETTEAEVGNGHPKIEILSDISLSEKFVIEDLIPKNVRNVCERMETDSMETPSPPPDIEMKPDFQITVELEQSDQVNDCEMGPTEKQERDEIDVKEGETKDSPENDKPAEVESKIPAVDESKYFHGNTMFELSRRLWPSIKDKQQYTRGCIWSPDGTCVLAPINMDGMHVIELPTDLYGNKTISTSRRLDKLKTAVHIKEGGTVYDLCWYPFMNSNDPDTCCWIASRQHEPMQMWDAFNGDLRCSYRGYDAVDEVEAAISLSFTSDGEKIIGGYKKSLKIFQTNLPGRNYTQIPTKQACSTIATHYSNNDLIATGSWNCCVNLYDLRVTSLGPIISLKEHSGGVTYVKYSSNGESIFSGARKDNRIFEWDLRNYTTPANELIRNVSTNQKIFFDVSSTNKWLCSGDTEGLLRTWNLDGGTNYEEYKYNLHNDCCNGVGIHPYRPILATTSGQYHFMDDSDNDSSLDDVVIKYENSITFWWIGESNENE